jgi:uncharacterized protein
MPTQIFVNLPVKDLEKSVAFFTHLGFTFNPQFTDEHATCMIVADNIFCMLLTEGFFQGFTKKPLSDARQQTEVIIALDAESREAVDTYIRLAAEAGGDIYDTAKDHGWMYQHCFADLDGHQWEIAYMDLASFPATA